VNRYGRRLDAVTDWVLERQWARRIAAPDQAASDPEWARIMDELNTLADAVREPPPATFILHPRQVLLYSRKLGVSPDDYRNAMWKQTAVLTTPAGRKLYRQLEAIDARYRRADDERNQR